jgi:hypothetical protein
MITVGSLALSARRWLTMNVLLAALSIGFAGQLMREMTVPRESPAPARPSPALRHTDETASTSTVGRSPAYSVVASRNLFSPTRTDTQNSDAAATIGSPPLNLVGVALAGERSLAFLEDPGTKHVHSYRVGDTVAGGIIRTIEATRIVLERSHQQLDVPLHDPSRTGWTLAAGTNAFDASDAGTPPAPATYSAPASQPPARRPEGVTAGRLPPITGATVPPITLESLPTTFGPGPTPPNATSEDLSLH